MRALMDTFFFNNNFNILSQRSAFINGYLLYEFICFILLYFLFGYFDRQVNSRY